MIDWRKNSALHQAHTHLIRTAIQYYRVSRETFSCDVTEAVQIFAVEVLEKDENFLLMAGDTHRNLAERLKSYKCPLCSNVVMGHSLQSCGSRSTDHNKYKSGFVCVSENCSYHFYSPKNVIDTINLIRDNKLTEIDILEVTLNE